MKPTRKTLNHLKRSLALAGLAFALPMTVLAQETPWSLRTGLATVNFAASETQLSVAGSPVQGGDAHFSNNKAVAFELGYALTPAITARFAFGIPPTTRLSAAGTLQSMVPPLSGHLGKVQYGPAVLTLTHSLGQYGRFTPYVGAGINYTIVTRTRDGDIADLKVKNAWGSVLQIGGDFQIDKQWSVFLDVRKVFVKTTASGSIPAFGSPPAHANVKLDPLIVHAGVGYRF